MPHLECLSNDCTNRGTSLVILAWVLFAVSTAIVGLRLWTRAFRVRRITADDYVILAGSLSELGHCTIMTIAYRWGLGRHLTSLAPADATEGLKFILVLESFSIMTSMFGRISFCVFLLYLVGPTKRMQRAILWANIIQQLAINTVMLIQIYAQCGSQIAALWDQEVAAHAKCQDPSVETDLAFAQSALNSVCDLVLAILPPIMLWDLQMPKATKYGLLAVMTLSVFGFAASLVKLVEIKNLGSRGDFTWNMVNLQIWVCVENNIVLMYASIPVLRPLLLQKKSGSSKNSRFESLSKNEAYRNSRRDRDGLDRRSARDVLGFRSDSKTWADGASEEYILQPSRNDQITRTTELRVTSTSTSPDQRDLAKDSISFS